LAPGTAGTVRTREPLVDLGRHGADKSFFGAARSRVCGRGCVGRVSRRRRERGFSPPVVVVINATCAAQTPIGPISQMQTFNLSVDAPLETADASPFVVTLPGGTTTLQKTAGGFPAQQYSDLFQTYQITGGSIVPGSSLLNGTTTYNNGTGPTATTTNVTEDTPTQLTVATPGPLPTNNHNIALVTPSVTFNVQPDALGTPVLIKAHQGGSSLLITGLGPVSATCPQNDTTISKVLVGPATVTSFSVFETSVTKPASGTTTVPVTVSIVGPAPTGTVKVHYSTVDGTAVSTGSGKNYMRKQGTLTFKRGVTTRTIAIRVKASSAPTSLNFFVQLSQPTSGVVLRLDNARVDIQP
jgi:hypothetical protein